jgi:hypothetical protein
METYLYGHQNCLQYNDIITPCEIDNLENIENCLHYIDSISTENSSDNNSDNNCFKKNYPSFGQPLGSEQLNLLIKPKERYRYSTNHINCVLDNAHRKSTCL